MPLSPSDSALDLTLLAPAEHSSTAHAAMAQEVQGLFDQYARPLLRYAASFGLSADDTEDVVQDVFLALFRHFCLGRSRDNVPGWLFQVTHNLALKQRKRIRTRWARDGRHEVAIAHHTRIDASPNPEERLAEIERLQSIRAVLPTLPARDRRCLYLRAEGLRYRDIAKVLGLSLGGVAKSLARSIASLVNAAER